MSPSSGDRHRPVVAVLAVPAGWVVAGTMLLSTSVLRWVDRGPGSRFGGLELADNLRTGALSPSWGGWVALTFYCVIGIGGAFIATAVVERAVVVAIRGALCASGLVAFGLLAWVVLPIDKWAAGPTMASISFLLSTTLSAYQILTSTRT